MISGWNVGAVWEWQCQKPPGQDSEEAMALVSVRLGWGSSAQPESGVTMRGPVAASQPPPDAAHCWLSSAPVLGGIHQWGD